MNYIYTKEWEVRILELSEKGPNLKMEKNKLEIFPPYFSLRWYFQNALHS